MRVRPFFLQIRFSSVSNEFPLYTNEQREETAHRAVSAFLLLLIILCLIKPTTNPKNYNDIKYVMKKQEYWTYVCSCE